MLAACLLDRLLQTEHYRHGNRLDHFTASLFILAYQTHKPGGNMLPNKSLNHLVKAKKDAHKLRFFILSWFVRVDFTHILCSLLSPLLKSSILYMLDSLNHIRIS